MGIFLRKKLQSLAASRSSDAACVLTAYAPVPPEFAAGIVAIVSGLLPLRDFPVLPTDGLWSLFDLEQGCLEDELEGFLQRVAPSAPELARDSTAASPQTVRELVFLVYQHAQPFLTSKLGSAA